MTYIENIFICMASPLLVAALCMGRRRLRFFLFGVAGMGVCLLSAYINTFLAAVYQADALAATVEIAPVVEEVMKLKPGRRRKHGLHIRWTTSSRRCSMMLPRERRGRRAACT